MSKIKTSVYFLLFPLLATAQTDETPRIQIAGVVYDGDSKISINNLMVINKTTQQGFFAGASGSFAINAGKNDTLIIAATGYQNAVFCFKDSALQTDYFVRIYLKHLQVQLKEVRIIAPRDLDDIQRDIEKLGYKKSDYVIGGADALSSPITFLYSQYSKRERARRHIAQLRNEDKKRELLKELLAKYVANEVINLSDDEFDHFIDYCNVSDAFMQNATQYEFIMFIKRKFEFYRLMK
ncbi:MAG: hypothetical protein JNK61_02700 [Bacteroidia bacterium]|nr:hypothetical protein [Bacteroidia bacterium]